jgi:hypothetical protein
MLRIGHIQPLRCRYPRGCRAGISEVAGRRLPLVYEPPSRRYCGWLPGVVAQGLSPSAPQNLLAFANVRTGETVSTAYCLARHESLAIHLVTLCRRPPRENARGPDAPMSVKAFFSADWRIVDLLGCGHDRDGPLPVGGQALIRSRAQQGTGIRSGRQIGSRPARGAAAVIRARPLRKWPQVRPAAARPRRTEDRLLPGHEASKAWRGARGGRQIGSRPARGAAADMRARPSRELAGQAPSRRWR